MKMNNRQPQLPPLFFLEKKAGVRVGDLQTNGRYPIELPPEILHQCLVKFADWGDLAKLACVQKSWCKIMMDAASIDDNSKWQLAQALMDGSCGLNKNHNLAMKLLLELANVETNDMNVPTFNEKVEERFSLPSPSSSSSSSSSSLSTSSSRCFSPAMKLIAKCYFDGTGVLLDAEKGLVWLKASFEMGNDINSAKDVAEIYERGHHGIDVDIMAATEWLAKAATAGHVEAMAELGLCYELGCGVAQSDEIALEWYIKAANEGHIVAKFAVGEAYEEARGVPQSDEEACLWYYKAAALGDEDSVCALRRLEGVARIVLPGVGALLDE